jgi:hypothetical protein
MAKVSSRRSLNTEAEVHARSIPVEFVADEVALGQVFLRVIWFSPTIIIPLWHSIHIYNLGDEQ